MRTPLPGPGTSGSFSTTITMSIKDKLAAVLQAYRNYRAKRRAAYQQARADHYKHTHGHHPCEARGTATKNTQRNIWNIRPRKSRRQESRLVRLQAFEQRYGIA